MISSRSFAQRRAALRAALSGGIVLLPGNLDSPMNYRDNIYPFRQDSSFRYFFGIDQPGLVGVIDLDAGHDSLFGSDAGLDDIVWTGPLASLVERAATVGVERTANPEALHQLLRDVTRSGRRIHYLPPYRGSAVLHLAALLSCTPTEIQAGASLPLADAVVALRSIKSAEEVAEMESALEVAADMHLAAMRHTRPGVHEYLVVGRMEGIARERDRHLAYPSIFSHRGEILHNHDHSHCLQRGEWVVNDSGCNSPGGYASDITRTLPVGGRFSTLQRELYGIVHAAQSGVIAALKPGVAYLDMHRLAARTLVDGLRALGVFRGDGAECVDSGAYAIVFPHGLGHQIGLDVHDMEALGEDRVGYDDEFVRSTLFGMRSLRLARTLQAGFAITVEPGLYLIPALFEQWRAERRFAGLIDYAALEKLMGAGGVRIEDDVLITPDGARVLGPPIPRSIDEVEAAMAA